VSFELWYGVMHSARQEQNAGRLTTFLSAPVEVLSFDDDDAKIAAGLRAHLRRAGTPIGPYDVLIAGQALRHGLTLVTANVGEFSRVPGLAWEDWTA
jgi:tRNA(fMet)-specific endonuclease VapC